VGWARIQEGPGQRAWLPWVFGITGSVAVAASWIPVRDRLSNVNVALLLVAVPTLVGLTGRRAPIGASAVVAALCFDVFDTAPYGTLAIARAEDVVTTLMLALVGVGGGELAVRARGARRASGAGVDGFNRVRDAAALAAEGEETALVVGSVAEEIRSLLGLRECRYEAGVPAAGREVSREGMLRATWAVGSPGALAAAPPWDQVALPVWGHGQRIGTFLLVVTPGVPLDRPRCLVAVTLADQAGAALAVFEPPHPTSAPDGSPAETVPGHLRLLH
jgi:hypothetical protein